MYEVMARRYRPALFEQVVGQEHIAATLKNAITRDRVAHAYMFTGGHGCGKTTMARILAKALVCEKGPTPTPCCVCPICVDVAAGRDADVLEIDGASNNGIEQIRQLREQAAYVPTRARYKIYIIDEVHMLSDGAFNALLKTLEEPPRHVIFILATTDPHKVPDTILSRCQRFDFRLVPQAKLSAFFRLLAGEEKAEISDEALDAVGAFAEGSVRDGLVLLDQLLSFADGRVERGDVEAVRGVASAENVSGLFAAIVSGNVKEALAVVDEVASRGTSVGDFLDQLISFGRDLMLLVAGRGDEGISAYGPARERLTALAKNSNLEQALLFLDVLTNARTRVRSRALSNPLVALEMAVARLAGLGGVTPVAELLTRLSRYPLSEATPLPLPRVEPEPVALVRNDSAAEAAPEQVRSVEKAVAEAVPAPGMDAVAVVPSREEAADPSPSVAEPERRESQSVALDMSPPTADEEPDDFPFDPDPVPGSPGGAPHETRHEEMPVAEPAVPAEQVEPEREEFGDEVIAVPDAMSAEEAKGLWTKILDRLAERHPADLRHTMRVNIDGVKDGKIVISGSATAIEAWYDKHRLERLTEAASQVMGRPAEFSFEAKTSRRMQAVRVESEDQATLALTRHPAVDKVRSLFDGVIVHTEVGGETEAISPPSSDPSCGCESDDDADE